MTDFRLAWTAFKNMLRAVGRDPLWAFVSIVTGPFRAAGYVARMGVLFFLVLLVVGGGLMALMQWAGIQRGDVLWYVGNIAFTAFLALLLFGPIGPKLRFWPTRRTIKEHYGLLCV